MKVKIFYGSPEVVQHDSNLWLEGADGPSEVLNIAQSQTYHESASAMRTDRSYPIVSLSFLYKPKAAPVGKAPPRDVVVEDA